MRCTILPTLSLCAVLVTGCASNEGQLSASRRDSRSSKKAASFEITPAIAERVASTPGDPRIRISLGDQKAYLYKGGEVVAASPISTGKPGHSTPRGSFSVVQKNANHVSGSYGQIVNGSGVVVNGDASSRRDPVPPGGRFVGAPMPYFMRFNHGIGMHAGYLPGYPASHGCVRMPREMAQLFYAHAPVGTPVAVTE